MRRNLQHEFAHNFDHLAKISDRFSYTDVINNNIPKNFWGHFTNSAYLRKPDEIFARIWAENEASYPDEIYDWFNKNIPSLKKGLASGPRLVPEIETGPLSRLLTKLVKSLPDATPNLISNELLDLCQTMAAIEQTLKQPGPIVFSLLTAIPGFLVARSIGATLMPLAMITYLGVNQRPDRGVRKLAESLERKWRPTAPLEPRA